ncbi:hypothetical protein MOC54_21885, partial [Bacillus spizizenii]|nr:hypothetical protein [Bacillus spizizenii]
PKQTGKFESALKQVYDKLMKRK